MFFKKSDKASQSQDTLDFSQQKIKKAYLKGIATGIFITLAVYTCAFLVRYLSS